jgi:hypothetical protein
MELNVGRLCTCLQGALFAMAAMSSTPRCAVADVLVADRLSDSVYRYSSDGVFLNVVLTELDAQPENDFINQPTGMAISPDGKQLYVSSSQTNSVVRYDYDALVGTASNPVIFATAASGLQFPNAISFSPDGATIYVSNLGGTGLSRFNLDGSSAGAALAPFGGGSFNQLSGQAWTPTGELLVNGFVDYPGGTTGAVAKSDAAIESLTTFIGPSTSVMGASGILVHGDYVYVTGMFASNLQRFHLADGTRDSSFGVSGLAFPQGLMLAPDGNGILAGILGYSNGQGHIAHYDFSGAMIGDGVFASPGGGGFQEATAFVQVPGVRGDFNGDRLVDAADLELWKLNFGANDATLAMGDADRNGVVDGADFLIWQRNFTSAAPSASLVPEPTISVFLLLVPYALRRRCSSRKRRGANACSVG